MSCKSCGSSGQVPIQQAKKVVSSLRVSSTQRRIRPQRVKSSIKQTTKQIDKHRA